MFKKIILLVVGLCSLGSFATDYCKKELCWFGKHIACKNRGEFGPECPKDRVLLDISEFRNFILDYHNELRDRVASGKLKGFKSAERMGTLQWDNELEKLAEYHAKSCLQATDDNLCHNTDSFKYSGQNALMMPSTKTTKLALEDIMNVWFNEYELGNMDAIDNYQRLSTMYRFSTLVIDRNTHVGCAASKFTISQWPNTPYYYLVCNYGMMNIEKQPIYKAGPPASKCEKKNPKYKALCDVS